MSIDRRNRITFEETADLFNEVRPGYPLSLVDDVLHLSGISPNGRILEIGCGPGNATLPFAQRGFHITAVELGTRLSELAAQNLSPFPNVTILNSSFEEWSLEKHAFDLVIAAEALHWIPPEIAYPKVAASLKDFGSAAFFWNVIIHDQSDLSQELDKVYKKFAPQIIATKKEITVAWLTAVITHNFEQSECFEKVSVHQYPWSIEFTVDRYIKFLKTSSFYRNLDEGVRAELFKEIGRVINQFGGSLVQERVAVLFHAKVSR